MKRPDNCPHCGVSLFGDPIPADIRQHYSPPYVWRREIGIEIPGVYDGVLFYECPDCRGAWNRWANQGVHKEMHDIAEHEMAKRAGRRA